MLLPTDTLDDQILEAGTNGFVALDETTKATLLADTALQAAKDSICRTDGIIGPRPGLRHCGRAEAHGLANGFDTQAALFFGVGGYQALLHMRAGSPKNSGFSTSPTRSITRLSTRIAPRSCCSASTFRNSVT